MVIVEDSVTKRSLFLMPGPGAGVGMMLSGLAVLRVRDLLPASTQITFWQEDPDTRLHVAVHIPVHSSGPYHDHIINLGSVYIP